MPSAIFNVSPSSLLLLNVFFFSPPSESLLCCVAFTLVQCSSDSNSEAYWRETDKKAGTDGRKGEVRITGNDPHASVKEAMTHAAPFIFSGDPSVTYEYFP